MEEIAATLTPGNQMLKSRPSGVSPAEVENRQRAPLPVQNEEVASDSMEAVRELLFGKRANELSQSMAQIEARMVAELESLSAGMRRRIDSLESFVRGELALMAAQIKRETESREVADAEIRRLGEQRSIDFAAATKRLGDEIQETKKEAASRLLEESKGLSDEISSAAKRLQANLDRTAEGLQAAMAPRSDLGEMLVGIGMQLRSDPAKPTPSA